MHPRNPNFKIQTSTRHIDVLLPMMLISTYINIYIFQMECDFYSTTYGVAGIPYSLKEENQVESLLRDFGSLT